MKHTCCAILTILGVLAGCTAAEAVWQAETVEDEGGAVMQAYVESGDAAVPTDLRLQCLGNSQIALRYSYGSDLPADAHLLGDSPLTFAFAIDVAQRNIAMRFAEMDGAFAAYIPKRDSLISAIASGSMLSINDPTGLYHVVDFTLDGSSHAIAALPNDCK